MKSLCVHRAVLLSFFAAGTVFAQAQSSRIWLFFQDRGQQAVELTDPSAAQKLGISKRALWRRSKVLPPDRLLDERDLPVAREYLDKLRGAGIFVRTVSRWLNAASVEIPAQRRVALPQFPFISHSKPVARLSRSPVEPLPPGPLALLQKRTSTLLDYGQSFLQLNNINAVNVHNLGINGKGVVVGMIDDGFNNHRVHSALKNISILAEYDFVQADSNTSRAPGEYAAQGNHGAGTLSSIGGFEEGQLIGAAFGATFVLAKTEVDSVEVHAEEDNYVAALEWMERIGVDIASSSLGYKIFDGSTYSYTYQDLNGRTTIVSRAATVAASKGVLLATAMGNEGSQIRDSGGRIVSIPATLVAPADADSILAVGAVYSFGQLASFSGTGPTSDSRTKPEIAAQGTGVWWANGSSLANYFLADGTSASTPLAAGAAALVLSAHPELSPTQLREALINTASRVSDGTSMTSSWPNDYYGYGIANTLAAVTYHGIAFSNQPMVIDNTSSLEAYIYAISSSSLVADSLLLFYQESSGGPFLPVTATPTSTQNLYKALVPSGPDSSFPRGYFSARDNLGRTRRIPYSAPDSLLILKQYTVSEIPGLNPIPKEFILNVNYPNPFNAGTTITFDAPVAGYVELHVYDLLGRQIKTIFRGNASRGRNVFSWDGTDESGKRVSTGVYFSRLRTSDGILAGRMLFLQ